MSFSIRIETNLQEEIRKLGVVQRDIKRVAVATVNELAFTAVLNQKRQMPRDIDRPTRFTLNSMSVNKATSGKTFSEIFVRPVQAEYLQRIVYGGIRKPLKSAVFIPSPSQRNNRYGNMPRARRRKKLGSPNLVVIERGTSVLAYERVGGNLNFIGSFRKRTVYRKRTWKFHEHNVDHVDRTLPVAVRRSWDRIMSRHSRG